MDGQGSTEGTQRRTEPGPSTRDRRPGADRLGALSDELLLHILSFLRIREAVSTSRLSRRWRYLFHNLPSLDFSEDWNDPSASAWFIDRVLLLHAAPRIELFRLSMRVEDDDSFGFRRIDSRLLFAVRRGVRALDLDIDVPDPYNASYGVPPWVFHCKTLEDLSVENCHLRLPSQVRLVSLKKMHLGLIEFHYDELECLLRGCPLLQSLELMHCNNYVGDLVIGARECRNLEELVIVDGIYVEDCPGYNASKMQIYAPSVKYLSFRSAAFRGKYEVMDLSSVVVASFQLSVDGGMVMEEGEADVLTTGLLLWIPQVQVLKLCRWSLQALSKRELQGNLVSALPGVTRLELTIGFREPELQAIISALRVCSKLRTLVLNIQRHTRTMASDNSDSDETDETESHRSFSLDSSIVMQDLKTIMTQGLMRYYNQDPGEEGGEAEVDFMAQKKENDIVLIGFLLRVSPVLEELIVQPSKGMIRMARNWELLSNLLSLPRASPHAKVIINGKYQREVKQED